MTDAAIDCHFHLFRAGIGQPGARYVPDYDATFDQWLALGRRLGFSRGVFVQTSFLGTDNTQLLDALTRRPDVLRGIAVIGPDADAAVLAPLHAAGVRGFRLNLLGRELPAAWDGAAVWSHAAALGWHVEIHTDDGALPQVLARVPAVLPVVLDHFGRPASVQADDPTFTAVAARARQVPVHVKLSAAYRVPHLDPARTARRWLDVLGPDALLWGTDWPCTNHENEARDPLALRDRVIGDWVEATGVAALRRRIVHDNPVRLYGFDHADGCADAPR